jgi:coproporphyrinogen III oxidase
MNRRERVSEVMRTGQRRLIEAFERVDGFGRFLEHDWERPGGGGGWARSLEGGRVFEKAGVNMSAVHGKHVPPSLAKQHPEAEGKPYFATGLSLVLHPLNPFVPAFHANFRYFEVGEAGDEGELWWFGGGADMTPNYPFEEDPVHFHRTLRALCERHPQADYPAMKETCDRYFTVRHRNEMRGVGGIFYDELSPPGQGSFETDLAFTEDGLATLIPAYLPIVERRKDMPFGEREREWQLYRRGRYVEFNLVYDRGTLFGLQTQGNIEAILMSMPPYARWEFDYHPEPGSAEARMLEFLQPRDWVGVHAEVAAAHSDGTGR